MLNCERTTLPSGLRLITAPLPNTRAVTVLFLVGVGSRYEEPDLNGISHFLEHMLFKGTKKRPTTLDIAKSLDAVGASYNAFTSEEHTGFFVRASAEHFNLALEVLFDMLYGSIFKPEEIAKEKGVIAEEINMYQDNPQSYIGEVAKKLFYGNHPLGREVTGKKETILKFERKDFLRHRERFYHPSNTIIAVAGGKNKNSWESNIEDFFQKMTAQKKANFQKVKTVQNKPKVLCHYKKTDQAHLILGFRTIPRKDARRPILKVLNNLLGENMSSRLFTEVRERRGLAYYVSSEMADFQDTGVLGVAAGVDIARVEEAVKVILAEFQKLKTAAVATEEILKAQENLKGRLFLGLEESFAVADFLAEEELFLGKIESPEDLVKKYQAVTSEEIKNFAKEFFQPKNLNLAMIGPFKNIDNFQKILNNFSHTNN